MKHLEQEEIRRGFDRLLARAPAPTFIALLPGAADRSQATAGDLWWIRVDEEKDEEPQLVMLMENTGALFQAESVWRAAPVFSEVEMATDEDVVLPCEVAGGKLAVALGCEAPVAQCHFLQSAGRLPAIWLEKMLNARYALETGAEALPDDFLRGVPVVHQDDPALAFREELVRRLEPTIASVLAESLAIELAPAAATTPWLAAEWERWKAATQAFTKNIENGLDTLFGWVGAVALKLEGPTPASLGFHADDGLRSSDADVREGAAIEVMIPEINALVLLVRESPSQPNWNLQVLEDPSDALEGAEIVAVDGQVLAEIHKGVASRPFIPLDGWLVLRLANGRLSFLRRNED